MSSNEDLIVKQIVLKRNNLISNKKYKKRRKIKRKARKAIFNFSFIIIILILLSIVILFIVFYFISKKMFKRSVYPKDDITLVSAYYKIKSKYASINYRIWLKNIVLLNTSIVFFTNKNLCQL